MGVVKWDGQGYYSWVDDALTHVAETGLSIEGLKLLKIKYDAVIAMSAPPKKQINWVAYKLIRANFDNIWIDDGWYAKTDDNWVIFIAGSKKKREVVEKMVPTGFQLCIEPFWEKPENYQQFRRNFQKK